MIEHHLQLGAAVKHLIELEEGEIVLSKHNVQILAHHLARQYCEPEVTAIVRMLLHASNEENLRKASGN